MTEVYLLLGSNEGKPEENLHKAIIYIEKHCGTVTKRSSLYQTEAWGVKEQNSFLNQAISISTTLPPEELLNELKAIEKRIGRVTTTKWGPRVIDIDILFFGDQLINLPDLKIPHPYIPERRFTLIPLNEIAPTFVHPALGKTIAQLLMDCKDKSVVVVMNCDF